MSSNIRWWPICSRRIPKKSFIGCVNLKAFWKMDESVKYLLMVVNLFVYSHLKSHIHSVDLKPLLFHCHSSWHYFIQTFPRCLGCQCLPSCFLNHHTEVSQQGASHLHCHCSDLKYSPFWIHIWCQCWSFYSKFQILIYITSNCFLLFIYPVGHSLLS